MNTIKILSFMVLGLFLISTASALIGTNGRWQDYSQDIEIDEGESVQFDVYFMTYDVEPPMNVAVRLYQVSDSGEKLIHTFTDSSITNDVFEHTYSIDKNIYKTDGEFKIILSGSDSDGDSDETILKLKVVEVDNGEDSDDDDKDKETNKQRYTSEDEFDKQKYLEQFEPKTITTESTQETAGTPTNSWIIWLIVGLIVLVVLIIVISSLRK